MITVVQEYTVNAPVEDVFTYIANPKNDQEWQASCQGVNIAEDAELKAGLNYEIIFKFLGRNMPFQSVITDYDHAKTFGYETLTGPIKFKGRYVFAPCDEGTAVQWTFDAEPGKFFGVVPVGLVRKIFEKQVEADIKRLISILTKQQEAA